MEKINGTPLYWLGSVLGALLNQLSEPSSSGFSIAIHANQAITYLEYFSKLDALPLSAAESKDILNYINRVYLAQERIKEENLSYTDQEKNALRGAIYQLQTIISSELPRANFFYATQKRAYDMTALINRGESVLSSTTIIALEAARDKVVNDIREASKCLAFGISTAVGFHIFRAIESIIVESYFPVLKVNKEEWERNKNLGHYISILEKNAADDKVTSVLRHLKDNYRNPIAHPDEVWDVDMAENAFQFANSVINTMVQDIIRKRKQLTA